MTCRLPAARSRIGVLCACLLATGIGLAAPAAYAAPNITWVVPPPPTSVSGEEFPLVWNLSGFTSPVSQNGVAYGVTKVEGTSDNQPGGNGTYSETFIVPEVTASLAIKFVAYALYNGRYETSPVVSVAISVPVTDTDPPAIIGQAPASDQTDVPLNARISVRVRDETGVDAASLRMRVAANASWVPGSTSVQPVVPGNPLEYDVVFTPEAGLPPGTLVQAGVDAADVFGNAMPMHVFGFRTLVPEAAEQFFIGDLDVAPHPRLGLAFPGGNSAMFSKISGGGIGVVRVSVDWSTREPSRGVYDWQGMDNKVRNLQRLGIDPFLTIYSDAEWATDPDTWHVKNSTPLSMSRWRGFVQRIVERYDGDGVGDSDVLIRPVKYYQVANEWESSTNKVGGWASGYDRLVVYVNAAYDGAKAADPNAVFVLGGIASLNADILVLWEGLGDFVARQRFSETSSVEFTREDIVSSGWGEMYEALYTVFLRAKYDWADIHMYGPPERDPLRLAAFRPYVSGRPFITSECGGPSLDYSTYTAHNHFMAVMHRVLIDLSQGMPFSLWFNLTEGRSTWGNQRVALMDEYGRPKPGYRAYQLLSVILEDMRSVQYIAPGQYLIHRSGASPLFVAWYPGEGPTSVGVPPGVDPSFLLRVTSASAASYTLVPNEAGPVSLTNLPLVVGDLPQQL